MSLPVELSDQLVLDARLAGEISGTALRRRLHKEGRLLSDRGWPHHTLFDVTYRPDRMGVAELETAFRDALRVVFAPDAVCAAAKNPSPDLAGENQDADGSRPRIVKGTRR